MRWIYESWASEGVIQDGILPSTSRLFSVCRLPYTASPSPSLFSPALSLPLPPLPSLPFPPLLYFPHSILFPPSPTDGLGSDEIPEYRAGETDHWRSVGPPHKHRYLSLREDPGASDELGQLLWDIRTNLMANPAFAKLLAYVSSADLKKYR